MLNFPWSFILKSAKCTRLMCSFQKKKRKKRNRVLEELVTEKSTLSEIGIQVLI